jgi:ParB-like chromosome segregation protein Spo0J
VSQAPAAPPPVRLVPVADLFERFARLRLLDARAVERMRCSLERHGQLAPITLWRDGDALQVVDGFKRLHAARALGHRELRAAVVGDDAVAATVAVLALNDGGGVSEMEEAWLCRELYRVHRLTQPHIGALLGRDKSWVCRRLVLAEGLDEAVQTDVRLGRISPRAACEVGRLSRDNQGDASALAQRRGMTVAQVRRMVAALLAMRDPADRARWLAEMLTGAAPVLRPATAARAKSEGELLLGDVEAATRTASRLQVRLRDKPLSAFEAPMDAMIRTALGALGPVLSHLVASVERVRHRGDLRDAAAAME